MGSGRVQSLQVGVHAGQVAIRRQHQQTTHHAALHLQVRRAVLVGVVPVGAHQVVRRDVVLVQQGMLRVDVRVDVVFVW